MALYIGIGMIAAALWLRYIVGKRRYKRRNTPIQKVPSYNLQLWRRFRDEGLVFVCYFLFILGIMCILAWAGSNGKF
jgi:hypothetical protein